jgi:hypothetical protein
MQKKISLLLSTLSVLTLLFMGTFSHAHGESAFDVQKAIKAGDHKGLAEYYRAEAATYRQLAQKHKKMEITYFEANKESETTYLPKHCAELVTKSNEMAAIYEKLAKAEEELSKKK